jgi:glycosyltransferase involved in cell wall biosynthesis
MTSQIPLVSIIIPLYVISDRFFSDLKKFAALSYKNYEILIVTDIPITDPHLPKTNIILTHLPFSGPAEKRDIGLKKSKGIFCAFIDDDAYPHPRWLNSAIHDFQTQPNIVAVGGPGVTPPEDALLSQYGGMVYESIVTSGKAKHRFISKGQKIRTTEDWPAFNLIVRKKVLNTVKGYNCSFYGGEDTFLCLKLITHGRILYDPRAIVFHHRRPLFLPHLKQIYNIGLHRGFFFKKFPRTSRKLFYLFPSILTIGLVLCIGATIAFPFMVPIFFISFLFFFFLAMLTIMKKTTVPGMVMVSIGIILTHISYGIAFIHGLLLKSLSH